MKRKHFKSTLCFVVAFLLALCSLCGLAAKPSGYFGGYYRDRDHDDDHDDDDCPCGCDDCGEEDWWDCDNDSHGQCNCGCPVCGGNVKPTPTPKPTCKPKPTPTPTPEPTPSPSQTPIPTPTSTPFVIPSPSSNPVVPPVNEEIEPDDVPPDSPTEIIEEEEVPIAQTGDPIQSTSAMLLGMAALAAAAGLVLYKKES